ncbi:MAG: flagellar biosynthetic protein FliO [Planctomycetia bacterium]|jgi:flagellar biogenesis protein FliO
MVQNILRCGISLCLVCLLGTASVHADNAATGGTSGEIYRAFNTASPNVVAPSPTTYPANTQAYSTSPRQAVPLTTVMSETPQREPARMFEDQKAFRHGKPISNYSSTIVTDNPAINQVINTSNNDASSTNYEGEQEPSPLRLEPQAPTPENEALLPVPTQNAPRELPPADSKSFSPTDENKLKLTPEGEKSSQSSQNSGLPMLVTMGGSLLLVIGLFLLFAWMMRRTSRRTGGLLPKGVVEVLGHQPLAGRQQVHLVRLGNRILLLSVMPDSVETLTEITDPTEVDRIAGICHQSGTGSSTSAFQSVMRQYSQGTIQIPDQPPTTVDQLRQRLGT